MNRRFKAALLLPVMLFAITGSAFAEDAAISNNGEGIPLSANAHISEDLKNSELSDSLPNELEKNITVSRDFAASEDIHALINYTEANGPLGKWAGTLYRTNNPVPVALPDEGFRVYFKGTVYKDSISSALPVSLPNELEKNITISRDFAANEDIHALINYSEASGSLGKWSGVLYRTNNPVPEVLPDEGFRVYFKGTVYKDLN